MFFKQCLNRNITRIANSQLNSFRNMNTNISNEVLNKKLDYIVDSVTFIRFSMIGVISFGAGYVTTFIFTKLLIK